MNRRFKTIAVLINRSAGLLFRPVAISGDGASHAEIHSTFFIRFLHNGHPSNTKVHPLSLITKPDTMVVNSTLDLTQYSVYDRSSRDGPMIGVMLDIESYPRVHHSESRHDGPRVGVAAVHVVLQSHGSPENGQDLDEVEPRSE